MAKRPNKQSRRRKMKKIFALLVVTILIVSAASCTLETEARDRAAQAKLISTPTTAAVVPAGEPVKACLVTDSAGIGDKSFNDAVWGGLEQAVTDFGIEANYIESKSADDYAPNLQACVDSDPDLIVCVGFLMADACAASYAENPDIKYIGIDINWLDAENFMGVDAYMDQSCFQAGYLAAGMTETGTVATYTGFFGPVVQIFMDGFYMGVQEHNKVHGTDVKVLGYDPDNMDAATATGSWIDVDLGRQVTESFMDNGADIVLPVAGNVGTGSAAVMAERGYGYIFGVDQDWTVTNSQYTPQILGSVLKKMAVPVYNTVKTMVEGGEFVPGNFILEFENGGTEFVFNAAVDVPAELKAEVEALQAKILSGEISSLSPQFLALYPRN
ncbi:MAG: BMP family ABC transporter substrate-binding protein [Chloroflexi bacterium]|nr:BMP family ABC transporter substrate-binding protein [Chloroflexota bacterium]